jgi:hypothetical protein
VLRIGTARTFGGRGYSVFVKVKYDGMRLSISGVEGPLHSGNCLGSCGQIDMSAWNITKYAPGWNEIEEKHLRAIWRRWHLNDMRAECEHQRDRGETWKTHPGAACSECGWKLGHGLKVEPVPPKVLDELLSMPQTDRRPVWV